MDSEVICNPKNYDWLTDSLNNIGLRDASASKNRQKDIQYKTYVISDSALPPNPNLPDVSQLKSTSGSVNQ